MSKTISLVVDDKTAEMIKEIGKNVILTDNVSHIVRYALKYTHRSLVRNANVES